MIGRLVGEKHRIKERYEGYGDRAWVSDKFLYKISNILEKHHDDISGSRMRPDRIIEALRTFLSDYQKDLERIRYELARIPAAFIVVKTTRYNPITEQEDVDFIGLKTPDGKYEFALQSEECPDYVPDLQTLPNGHKVWCLCSQQQASRLSIYPLPYWQENDSPVEWIIKYVEMTGSAENDNASQPPHTTTPPTVRTPPTVQTDTDLTPTQLIYHYIRDNAPVSTADMLQQKFAGRSRTFAILKDLERDQKIEKTAHGVYKTVNSV